MPKPTPASMYLIMDPYFGCLLPMVSSEDGSPLRGAQAAETLAMGILSKLHLARMPPVACKRLYAPRRARGIFGGIVQLLVVLPLIERSAKKSSSDQESVPSRYLRVQHIAKRARRS